MPGLSAAVCEASTLPCSAISASQQSLFRLNARGITPGSAAFKAKALPAMLSLRPQGFLYSRQGKMLKLHPGPRGSVSHPAASAVVQTAGKADWRVLACCRSRASWGSSALRPGQLGSLMTVLTTSLPYTHAHKRAQTHALMHSHTHPHTCLHLWVPGRWSRWRPGSRETEAAPGSPELLIQP